MNIKRIVIILLLTIICGAGIIYYLGTCSSRCGGHNAAIKANLNTIHERVDKIYGINKNYSSLCVNSEVVKVMSVVASNNLKGFLFKGKTSNALEVSGGPMLVNCHLAQDNNSWVIASSLVDKEKAYSWCVDSTGAKKRISGYLAANTTVCP